MWEAGQKIKVGQFVLVDTHCRSYITIDGVLRCVPQMMPFGRGWPSIGFYKGSYWYEVNEDQPSAIGPFPILGAAAVALTLML